MLTPYIKKEKPPFPYDHDLSWSQLSTFKWRKEDWYQKYVMGEKSDGSPELEFGSMVDKKIQDDPTFLPEIVRYEHLQYKLKTNIGDIGLIGLPDALCLKTFKLRDYKTGRAKWDKKRADNTGQLTMYLLLIYLIHKISPEKFECYIDWIPTRIHKGKIDFVKPIKVKTIQTKRTLKDILKFANYIKDTRKEMELYYQNHL